MIVTHINFVGIGQRRQRHLKESRTPATVSDAQVKMSRKPRRHIATPPSLSQVEEKPEPQNMNYTSGLPPPPRNSPEKRSPTEVQKEEEQQYYINPPMNALQASYTSR